MAVVSHFAMLALLLLLMSSGMTGKISKPTPKQNLQKMVDLRSKHGLLIPMDSENFKKYVKSKHSKYSIIAMFTALKPSFKCEICPDAKNEFSMLASSHAAQPSETSNIFFVVVDYHNSQEAFRSMKLTHVPGFFYFPGDRKRKKIDTYDSRRSGYNAVSLSRWLAEIEGIKIKIIVPFDYSKLAWPIGIAFVVMLLIIWKPHIAMLILGNKFLWGIGVLFVVLLMTSGQMWNHIRKPAQLNKNRQGGLEYIHGSRGGQYIFESYIVMALNAAITLGFILLNEVQAIKHRIIKKAVGFLGFGVIVIFFGLLLSIFRMKNRSYPFSFIFN
ncbi:dolichyl-diphosphooligosaccharide--protein glycosyltransferase subunit MAGT1-like [Styela clava]